MSEVPESADVTKSPEAVSTPSAKSLPFRLVILLLVLTVGLAALVYDYAVARPAVRRADQTLRQLFKGELEDPDGDGAVTSAEVHALLGRQPADMEPIQNGLIEIYRWQGGLPYRTHDLYVVYQGQKNPLLHYASSFTRPPSDELPRSSKSVAELVAENEEQDR